MAQPVAEALKFVFLWWPDSDYGVVLSSEDHSLVTRFHAARRTARTWGGFISRLKDDAGYLREFMQFDRITPKDTDRLAEIEHDVWVLDDVEFPLTQCAEESFGSYGHHFPECDNAITVQTEYGMPLRLYPKSAYLAIKGHLTEAGHRISDRLATFPMSIYPY